MPCGERRHRDARPGMCPPAHKVEVGDRCPGRGPGERRRQPVRTLPVERALAGGEHLPEGLRRCHRIRGRRRAESHAVRRHLLRDLMKPFCDVLGVVCVLGCGRVGDYLEPFEIGRGVVLPPVQRANVEARVLRDFIGHEVVELVLGVAAEKDVVVGQRWPVWRGCETQDAGGEAALGRCRLFGDVFCARPERACGQCAGVACVDQDIEVYACAVLKCDRRGAALFRLYSGHMCVCLDIHPLAFQHRLHRLRQLVHPALDHPDA
mmetsp:Transcript_23045/g.39103  ORF Transcript_23045/g.39103 Transcript_23045/m.39103 type:complete len:264 (-) Transcript_23045:717-1508(-)